MIDEWKYVYLTDKFGKNQNSLYTSDETIQETHVASMTLYVNLTKFIK